jgi:hypothetical protein
MVDRIARLRIRGFKCLKDVEFTTSGMTAIIGDNGVGKSAIVEACEILSRCGGSADPIVDMMTLHGLRSDAEVFFGVELHSDSGLPPLQYNLRIRFGKRLADEFLIEFGEKLLMDGSQVDQLRTGAGELVGHTQAIGIDGTWHTSQPDTRRLAIRSFAGREHLVPSVKRVVDALRSIDIQLPFGVRPEWFSRSRRERSHMRQATQLVPAEHLELGGDNLVSAFQALRNRPSWPQTRDLVRLGLGDDVEDVYVTMDAAGMGALSIKRRARDAIIHMAGMSDGTLAYLAFVAMLQLRPQRSLLVFDEPELHLHPRLLATVMSFFASMSHDHGVLLTTHSDRVLDMLDNPAKQVVLARLNENDETVLERPNAKALALWLQDYRGLGAIRADGHENSVFVDDVEGQA